MRTAFLISVFLFASIEVFTQSVFRTIVSQQPIVAGESFAVQYVLENNENTEGFTPPLFKGLRRISGPDHYDGVSYGVDGPVSLKNIVFTLVAPSTGWITIPGAIAKVNGRNVKSNDVLVEVITKAEAQDLTRREPRSQSEYFLQPGEDPNEKLRKNLFMRVNVDKRSCYVGEPVLATFKLYSRLESRSDIVKNPGFYGFTVHDVLNLNDKHSTTEVVNGKLFDVHTVRMVQLYPLQAGTYQIDPMEISNRVEFSKSTINKKAEQKIVEGVFEKYDPVAQVNTVTVENRFATTPISITVKPLPEEKKPDNFEGATGNFSITATIENSQLSKNEQGNLLVTLEGEGNFVQLDAPEIKWPAGIEGFSPEIMDSLDKSNVPLKGTRTFRFPFVVSKAGQYSIPPISISFFNPDSNKYKTVSTSTIALNILHAEKRQDVPEEKAARSKIKSPGIIWMVSILVLIALVVVAIQILASRRKMKKVSPVPVIAKPKLSLDEEFEMAFEAMRIGDSTFYVQLQRSTWSYLSKLYGLSGSEISKHGLRKAMNSQNVDLEKQRELLELLEHCEIATFTKAEPAMGKKRLLFRIKEILRGL